MKAKIGFCWAGLALSVVSPCVLAETHNLNADWRFSWAKETIPLKQALASMEKDGVAVSQPAYDDSGWEVVSLPHPVNAHDSFDNHAVDAGEAAFRRGVMIYRKRFDWGTGNREEGTGNREEGTGNREEGIGNRERGRRF